MQRLTNKQCELWHAEDTTHAQTLMFSDNALCIVYEAPKPQNHHAIREECCDHSNGMNMFFRTVSLVKSAGANGFIESTPW